MARLSSPPPQLAAAIQNASTTYGVPADVLTGIWRVESGSSFPNPYVNSSGYGGLFGTTDWNGSPQSQANLAAQILAQQIQQHGGDLGGALESYSGGGYSTVPGQQTFGNLGTSSLGSSPTYQAPPRPGGSGGILSDIGGAANTGLNVATFGLSGTLEGLFGGNPISGLEGLLDPVSWFEKGVVKIMLWFAKPVLRLLEALMGFALILLGLYFLGKADTGEDVDLGKLAGLAVAAGAPEAKAAGSVGQRAARKRSRGRTASSGG